MTLVLFNRISYFCDIVNNPETRGSCILTCFEMSRQQKDELYLQFKIDDFPFSSPIMWMIYLLTDDLQLTECSNAVFLYK